MDIIESTPIQQLMDEVGMNLIDNDINIVLGNSERSNEAKQRLKELSLKGMKQIKKLQEMNDPVVSKAISNNDTIHELNRNAIEQIFIDYEDIVNKKAYVLFSTYNSYRRYLETTDDLALKKYIYGSLRTGLRYMGSSNYTAVSPIIDTENDVITDLKIVNSSELVNAIKKGTNYDATQNSSKKKLARLESIDEIVLLANVFQVVRQEDVKDFICTDEDVAYGILYEIIWNSISKYAINHPESNMKHEDLLYDDTVEKYEVLLGSKEYLETFVDVIKQNSRYIDIDKLLLIVAFRYIDRLERDRATMTEDNIDLIYSALRYMINEIKPGTSLEGIFLDDDHSTNYSLEQLKFDIFRFAKGRYIKRLESEELKNRLLANEVLLKDVDENELMLLTMKGEEICLLIENSDENAIYLMDKQIINGNDMVIILSTIENCSERLFIFMCQKNILSAEQIIDLFENGIISAEYILKIKDTQLFEEINNYGKQQIKELYIGMSDKKDDNENTSLELFNKYATLYKALNLTGKSEEELFDEAFKLISSFDDIDSDMLQELYQFGIIPLEAAADWGVNLIDMLSSNSLKPTDLKKLYGKEIISIENIRNVILNGGLLYEEKLDLIYSTFDGDSKEESAIREELVELLETGESYRASINGKRGSISKEQSFKSREYITDPHARWKLISLLDKDYSKKFLPTGKEIMDGHRVFLLPNQDKIVIEKMHEKRYGRKVSAYGSATYIMDTEEFFKSMELIIVDGAINRTALRKLFEGEKAKKIIHTKNWGENVKEYFNINAENERYTEEDIIAIDKAIMSVVNSRKERE